MSRQRPAFDLGISSAALPEKTAFGRLRGNMAQRFVKSVFQAANASRRSAKVMIF
jgi:hypothetical protein